MEASEEEGKPKGKIIIASTPLGKNNWAYQMFMEAEQNEKKGVKGPFPGVWDEAHNLNPKWFEDNIKPSPEWFKHHNDAFLEEVYKQVKKDMEGMASFKCDTNLDELLKAGAFAESLWLTQQGNKSTLEIKYVGKHRVSGEFIFKSVDEKTNILDGEYGLNYKGINYKLVKENQEFYYLHNGSYVGNAMMWWRKGGGYTTNIEEAKKFTREESLSQHRVRNTDIPWNSDHVDARAIKVADNQYMDTVNILRP